MEKISLQQQQPNLIGGDDDDGDDATDAAAAARDDELKTTKNKLDHVEEEVRREEFSKRGRSRSKEPGRRRCDRNFSAGQKWSSSSSSSSRPGATKRTIFR